MIDPALGQFITSFHRKPNRALWLSFIISVVLAVGLFVFMWTVQPAAAVISAVIPGVLALIVLVMILRDKAQQVDIYTNGMTMRRESEQTPHEHILWQNVADIQEQYANHGATGGMAAGGIVGGLIGAMLVSRMGVGSNIPPNALKLAFKDNRRKLGLNWSYLPVFGPLQGAVLEAWLAEVNDQLRHGSRATIGQWEVSTSGVSTGKDMIPWSAITSVMAQRGQLTLAYRDAEKNKERKAKQSVGLRGAVLGALTLQMQSTGVPAARRAG